MCGIMRGIRSLEDKTEFSECLVNKKIPLLGGFLVTRLVVIDAVNTVTLKAHSDSIAAAARSGFERNNFNFFATFGVSTDNHNTGVGYAVNSETTEGVFEVVWVGVGGAINNFENVSVTVRVDEGVLTTSEEVVIGEGLPFVHDGEVF